MKDSPGTVSKERAELDLVYKRLYSKLQDSNLISVSEKRRILKLYSMTHFSHQHTAEENAFMSMDYIQAYMDYIAKEDTRNNVDAAKKNADNRIVLPNVYRAIDSALEFVNAHTANINDLKLHLETIKSEDVLKLVGVDDRLKLVEKVNDMLAKIESISPDKKLKDLSPEELDTVKSVIHAFNQILPGMNVRIKGEAKQLEFKDKVPQVFKYFNDMIFKIEAFEILEKNNPLNALKDFSEAGFSSAEIEKIKTLCKDIKTGKDRSTELEPYISKLRAASTRKKEEERIAAALSDFYGLCNERIKHIKENLDPVKKFVTGKSVINHVGHIIIGNLMNKPLSKPMDLHFLMNYNRFMFTFGEHLKGKNPTDVIKAIEVVIKGQGIEDLFKEPLKTKITTAINKPNEQAKSKEDTAEASKPKHRHKRKRSQLSSSSSILESSSSMNARETKSEDLDYKRPKKQANIKGISSKSRENYELEKLRRSLDKNNRRSSRDSDGTRSI